MKSYTTEGTKQLFFPAHVVEVLQNSAISPAKSSCLGFYIIVGNSLPGYLASSSSIIFTLA